ncbi:DUF2235 domain-containing protein [Phreatobacter aquaticus]|uniref:DUF2235 domain-containing protein n=1 Tax=Phreatobacter aquaticus TaxID=2570229 RepID=A0A4D7QG12_9HYPH|nr:DUF2235 domain-containing protein [Phreatobacter aquaticus]QCK84386.1 DUF2235 domain-containing protein [Phreatobacter aquaticus]
MSKRIVLLSDGTGNSSAKVWRTNVWRTFEALDLRGNDQVAIYDDGVGTSAFKPLAVLGGAFGYGLKRNVLDLYKFACRNYSGPEDEIFAFGFSRGAFTIRIVNGLILNQGLVKADSESELERLARAAYRAYRAEKFHTVTGIESLFRGIRDIGLRLLHRSKPTYSKTRNRQVENIRFLGLWDTVAAYGLPIDEMTQGVSKWLWPLALPDHDLSSRVQRACHALSLDDERTTFHPVLWNERNEAPVQPDGEGRLLTKNERISQVWFAGVHSNVGGGYPEDSLAHLPFYWILKEAEACGLVFKTAPGAEPDSVLMAETARDKDGRIYDSRSGLGGYYRYGPRRLEHLCNDTRPGTKGSDVFIPLPKVHESVLRRITNKAQAYGPLGLPATYAVVNDKGEILPPQANPYEKPVEARVRVARTEGIWNLVWWRRVVYFATVAATLMLLIYPLLAARPRSDEYSNVLRWVSDLIRIVGAFLPSFADTWVNGYARSPGQFLISAGLVVVLLLIGSALASAIASRMVGIWTDGRTTPKPLGWLDRLVMNLRTARLYQATLRVLKFRVAPGLFAALFLYLAIALVNHVVFIWQDTAGLTCSSTPAPPQRVLNVGESQVFTFETRSLCQASGVFLQRGRRYVVTIKEKDLWLDGGIPTGVDGLHTLDAPTWWQGAALMLGTPLRRVWIRPWMRLVGRYGETGGEEAFYDPDPDLPATINERTLEVPIVPKLNGELFFYVNDAVIAIPGLYDLFYRNNSGTAEITIKRTR